MKKLSKNKKIGFRIVAVLLIPMLILFVEIGLQIREKLKLVPRGMAIYQIEDPVLGYRLRPESMTPDGLAYVNADGIRGDSQHLYTALGSPRILFIGNSCVFGTGVRDTETFTSLLETRLHNEGWDSALVFNAGVGGYNSGQVREYLKNDLWKYKPTHLVMYLGWNDMVFATWPFDAGNVQLGSAHPRTLTFFEKAQNYLQYSRLFWSFQSRWRKFSNSYLREDRGVDVWNENYVSQFRENMDAMITEAKEKNVQVYVTLLPYDSARHPKKYSNDGFHYTEDGYAKLWREFQNHIVGAIGDSTAVIDLPSAIRGRESEDVVIYDYNHLGEVGHRLAADEIYRTLKPNLPNSI
ncbi:MAG: SGNH/GDSL hydrolase family protein [Candidatus Lindowbacteria bacterium]|nr:SGNH/GDSL hydrolase family protein [Candidatus Lindowbacteria bacterium]